MTHPDQIGRHGKSAEISSVNRHEFEALFRRHYASLCEYVRQYVKSSEVAEELVQDLFVRVWEMQSGAAPRSLTVSYLYTAARNRAIGRLRRDQVARRWSERTAIASDGEALTASPADEVHYGELSRAVERAVAALPDRCRLIFIMSREQGLNYSEIAEALEISVKTVETQMSRALKALRVKLAPFLGLALAISHARGVADQLFR